MFKTICILHMFWLLKYGKVHQSKLLKFNVRSINFAIIFYLEATNAKEAWEIQYNLCTVLYAQISN